MYAGTVYKLDTSAPSIGTEPFALARRGPCRRHRRGVRGYRRLANPRWHTIRALACAGGRGGL